MRKFLFCVVATGALAAVPVRASADNRMPVQQPEAQLLEITPEVLKTFLDRPFLQVIRKLGRPSAVEGVGVYGCVGVWVCGCGKRGCAAP